MSVYNTSQKMLPRDPPLKGSFPLDRDGYCKIAMLDYMICLHKNAATQEKCRQESKEYLECRMKHGLMDKEDWDKLGYDREKKSLEN
ncbi:unnamed protein product [Soboliphyme baturini]|uniref:CHCH domain-containing protein n=1 Tax=Soboliphyme baturini TaxID=241478 RepID=A0A183IRD7_9BILA|nr:unnamed protein product [Soboliphyme baturini]